ncbi:hypothetical protein BOTBODRAFT_433078 [Botryobasidium botryosum FD-172 SS1]|uniref:Uncharacterized protein n=1 Tax=Botryobasidium botryosum (strain FD-172 SS1) TaxID=930990 RepID=A0A067MX02_BOTB1|nr:hypothetical protein BOTBODRAFT_433078 [Botryobasidium botryosum FD-172 SS1]
MRQALAPTLFRHPILSNIRFLCKQINIYRYVTSCLRLYDGIGSLIRYRYTSTLFQVILDAGAALIARCILPNHAAPRLALAVSPRPFSHAILPCDKNTSARRPISFESTITTGTALLLPRQPRIPTCFARRRRRAHRSPRVRSSLYNAPISPHVLSPAHTSTSSRRRRFLAICVEACNIDSCLLASVCQTRQRCAHSLPFIWRIINVDLSVSLLAARRAKYRLDMWSRSLCVPLALPRPLYLCSSPTKARPASVHMLQILRFFRRRASINLFLPEIAGQIFLDCVEASNVDPCALASVCRVWRRTAHSLPSLWRKLNLDIAAGTLASRKVRYRLELWNRPPSAFLAPLQIRVFCSAHTSTFDHGTIDTINAFADALWEHGHYWESLSFASTPQMRTFSSTPALAFGPRSFVT